MRKHTHRLLAIVFLFFSLLAHAQSDAEKTLLKRASKQFESGEFLEALPSYSQLLSIAPDNKDYNFKYGVCLLASDEDVEASIKHFKYACADGSFEDKRAYYYLGKAYHLNYQFADALRSYNDFKDKADSKTLNGYREVDRLITMAENGKELMSDIKDIKVIDKTESTAGDFFRNYDMAVMGGSVIKVPEELLSSIDKKKGHSPIMFFPEGGGEIIFSSYGNESHLELYSVERTSDGGFSKPEKLPGVVNSPFDEDYPFLHSDGRTLYFSSKGHNSMGGYDVFRSKRDLSTGIFDTPVNLDFAISSPDDDIFYMVDREKRIANFASDRSSETGRLHVYKVAVTSAAVEMAIIQGKLVNNTGGNSIAQIKVLDANTDEEIGVYLTDEEGNYIIDLPGTGKYKFFVEAEESNVLHTGLVDVPSFGKIKAFKQEMILSEESAQEKLVIRNQFDQDADIDVMALIQEVIKQRAELDVNFNGRPEPEIEEVEEVQQLTESEIVSRAGFGEDVSIASVVEMGQEQSRSIASQMDAEIIERDKAYARAIKLTGKSEVMMAEAEQLYQDSQSAASSEEKEELLLMTSIKKAEAESAAHEAAIALVLAEEIDEVVVDKAIVVKGLDERNEMIVVSVESNDQETLISLLEDVKSFEDKAELQADALDAINHRSIESTREARKIISRVEEIRSSRDAAVSSIKSKETQLEKAKKQKDKDILEAELSSLGAEVEDLDQQLEWASTRLVTSQVDADNSEGAVKLLEQLRVGQMEDLVALRPLQIPDGGIEAAQLRVGNIQTKGEQIEISKEDLGRIMQSRPELLTSLSSSEKKFLEEISKYERASDPEVVSIDAEDIAEQEELVATDSPVDNVNPETDSSGTQDVAELVDTDDAVEVIDPKSTDGVDEERAITQEEELPRIESEEPNFPEETISDFIEEDRSTSSPDLVDYSEMSSSELLTRLQSDYQSAVDDIEKSDMIEIEKARASIDLNRAAVQVIDQKIIDLKYSSDYADNEIKQGNVKAMQSVVMNLEAEMLIIAAQTETPLAPMIESTASADQQIDGAIEEVPQTEPQDEIVEDVDTLDLPRTKELDSAALASQLDKSDDLLDMELEIEEFQADEEMSDLVRTASKIKSRSDFIQGLKTLALNDSTLNEEDKASLVSLIKIQQRNLETDIQLWQVDTGTLLTPTQMVLAKNDENYITMLTILQTSLDTQPMEVLDYEVSRKVMQDLDDLLLLGVDFTSQDDRRELLEYIESTSESEMTRTYESVYSEIAPVAEEKAWITDLISDRDVQRQVMAIRDEMALLLVYGDSEEDKFKKHIELNQDIAEPLRDELLKKEEEFIFVSKRKEVPAEVTQLTLESYDLSSVAKELREIAELESSLIKRAEILSKATLLDLSAIGKLAEAAQLQKHLNKGRDRMTFEYRDAIVINSDLLIEEAGTYAATISEDPSDIEEVANVETVPIDDPTPEAEADKTENFEFEQLSDNDPLEEIPSDENKDTEVTETPIEDLSTLYVLEEIDASEVIRTHPRISAELTEQDILPILSYDEEISLMSDKVTEVEYPGDWNETNATAGQLSALESKGVEIDKHERYRSELEETVVFYEAERKKRSIRLAEVIDEMNATGASEELKVEAERLAIENQIIDSYTVRAKDNIETTQVKIISLKEEQQAIVLEIDDNVSIVESESIAEEEFEIIPESPTEDIVEDIAEDLDEDIAEDFDEITEELPKFEEEVASVVPVPDYNAFVMPEVLTSDLFRVTAPDETRERTIPIDGKMPAGTVYQVQVGAFRNPIPEAHFSEFDPIMGTLLGNGITRYKVGLFQDESTAIVARDQIRNLGYSDAFVVKYIDGTRDGIIGTPTIVTDRTNNVDSDYAAVPSNADNSEQQIASVTQDPASTESGSGSTSTVQGSVAENDARTSRPLSSYDSDNTAYYEEAINAAPATQVERIEGLFYTVQVGVYSKPVTLASIFEINPLNSDLTPNGYIRYTSGIFDDLVVADQWKQKIRERGVQDAFVTAYYNGNRITLEQASQIIADQGGGVLVEIQELNSLDSDRQGQAIWEMVSTSDLFSDEVADQIDFKIRMGPYYERIPDKDVKVILDFEDNVEFSQLSDGAIIYTTKGRMNYDQAQEWRARFIDLGITNANIIALQNGEEVPIKQALDFLLK